ncbi:MAG: type IV pilus secretin PilQ [Burkholderiaceae bacterium]
MTTGMGNFNRLKRATRVTAASVAWSLRLQKGQLSTLSRGGPAMIGMAVAVASVFASGPSYAASNAIESVTTASRGDTSYLRIRMAQELKAAPPSFTISNPPRIAFDFADTQNSSPDSSIKPEQGELRGVNIVTAGSRSRVVLSLKQKMQYKTEIEGRDLLVTLDPALVAQAKADAPATQSYQFAQATSSNEHALRDVDFRRGQGGEGRIVVELSDGDVGVNIRQKGKQLVVDFKKTALPENLRRLLDVTDFGTPVKTVKVFQRGENTQLVIEPQGLWEHNAYQSDTQFVVEVRPIQENPNSLAQGSQKGYKGERLSLNFQNVDVRALLQVIADFTDLNIVTSDSVEGNLTLRLKDVPWDQALDIIMQSKGLDMRKNGNVLLVAPAEELAAKERLELESMQQLSELEPLRNEVFQLNYQKATALQELLASEDQRVLSERGSVVVDARTNKLFVQDSPSRLEAVRQLINQIDIPIRQVLIEARVVEADDRFSRNLGVKLGYNDVSSTVYTTQTVPDGAGGTTEINVPVYGAGSSVGGGYATVSGNLSGVQDLSSQNGSDVSGTNAQGLGQLTAQGNTNFVSLPAAAISGTSPAQFAVSLFGSSLTRFLNLELSALEADQRGKVVSSPRVLTADQSKAVIEQGTELPYQRATSSGATAVSFRKANLRLEVTPQITPEGSVILAVEVNRDAVGQLTSAGFAIDTRRVQTQVLVENGGTVVIGGIYEQFERNRTDKVPLLGDIPVLGYLFRSNQKTNDRTELMVFLTPRIVTDTALSR